MYLTFEEYISASGNPDIIDCATFARCEFRARKAVDTLTQGRIAKMNTVPDAVKLLMVEIVALEKNLGATALEIPAVASFNNDGYSESYAEPMTTEKVKELEFDLILQYLDGEKDDMGVPLLYLGVDT